MNKQLLVLLAVVIPSINNFAQDGTLDLSFDPGTGVDGFGIGTFVRTSSIQDNGKMIIGGNFSTYNGISRNYIARLNEDGTLDTSFDPGTGANDEIWATSIQSDGKIIIGGYFTSYDGVTRNNIARLNTDGSLDASFDPATGANSGVLTISIQNDGKIVIGGSFGSYNGVARNRIARLNPNGSLDLSFDPGTGADNHVHSTSIQPDGKIVIGGNFTSYNGTGRFRIARLNPDATLDTSFDPGTGVDGMGVNTSIRTTSIQADGKMIIGGKFATVNGTSINNIARLNADGSLDTSFDVGTGPNDGINTTNILSDGKIIIAGWFVNYDQIIRRKIARLNSDGSLDLSFEPGDGAGSYGIHTTSIQGDGKVIVGGNFVTFDETSRIRIARITNTITGISENSALASLTVYPNPFTSHSTFRSDHVMQNATLSIFNYSGQNVKQIGNIIGRSVTLTRDELASGIYFIRLTEENNIIGVAKLEITD